MDDLTLGQARVGVAFNPSGLPEVELIKQKAAELIDLIDALPVPAGAIPKEIGGIPGEVLRLKALAMTAAEEAAMWAVKAATKRRARWTCSS